MGLFEDLIMDSKKLIRLDIVTETDNFLRTR
jgi:hypothetical protein